MVSSFKAGVFAPPAAIITCARSSSRPIHPEQNGLIERFLRSLKEECVWQHNFASFAEARATITQWIEWYNTEPPHHALGYRSPRQFLTQNPKAPRVIS